MDKRTILKRTVAVFCAVLLLSAPFFASQWFSNETVLRVVEIAEAYTESPQAEDKAPRRLRGLHAVQQPFLPGGRLPELQHEPPRGPWSARRLHKRSSVDLMSAGFFVLQGRIGQQKKTSRAQEVFSVKFPQDLCRV